MAGQVDHAATAAVAARPCLRRRDPCLDAGPTLPLTGLEPHLGILVVVAPLPRLAETLGRIAQRLLTAVRPGGGSTLPGRLVLALDPLALQRLTRDRRVVLVSGTNGKTTTTHLLAAALATQGPVASNAEGANLLPGLVSALLRAPRTAATAVLETDERVLPAALRTCSPAAVVLLNLSRDQLDRHHEVAAISHRWRDALAELPPDAVVVADPGDPNVAWAAAAAPRVAWVATGNPWRLDSALCPRCGSLLDLPERRCPTSPAVAGFPAVAVPPTVAVSPAVAVAGVSASSGEPWACSSCGLAEPAPDLRVHGQRLHAADDDVTLALRLPGSFNVGNAAMAATAALALGVPLPQTAAVLADVEAPEGRFREFDLPHGRARLVLAKNPAGWAAALDLVAAPTVVLAVDATAADGRDLSWLWDVPFEVLAGRRLVVTGPRAADLAVRLRYADLPHLLCPDLAAALDQVVGQADVLATYAPFQQLRSQLRDAA